MFIISSLTNEMGRCRVGRRGRGHGRGLEVVLVVVGMGGRGEGHGRDRRVGSSHLTSSGRVAAAASRANLLLERVIAALRNQRGAWKGRRRRERKRVRGWSVSGEEEGEEVKCVV